jgi:hypothetical protein
MIESWNNIVHTAMMGTGKRQINETSLPEGLKQSAQALKENFDNQEEQFLGLASLVFNYRQCGVIPFAIQEVKETKAEAEEQAYANELAHQVLHDIIQEDSDGLLSVWLQWCSHQNKIVLPEAIPVLMEIAVKNKALQQLVLQCTGKRGEWLATFNDRWRFGDTHTKEEMWQTGTLEQRKKVLQRIRKEDAAKGLAILQSVWSQENAATKSELLKQLVPGLSQDDVPWLETLLSEKSEKVKDTATELLKRIPYSNIVQQYSKALRSSIALKEGRKILGIGSKYSLILALPPSFDEAIFKSGIEKLSNQKKFSDQEYIVYQLIEKVPPRSWQDWLQLDVDSIIALLKNDRNRKFLPALGSAASLFADSEWLKAIIKADENNFYTEVFSLLPLKEQELYALTFLTSDETAPKVIEELIAHSTVEWSVALTKAIFLFTAKRPYQYHQSFYKQNMHFIPYGINPELESCTPPDEYSKIIWGKTIDFIHRLLMMKLGTAKAFEGG